MERHDRGAQSLEDADLGQRAQSPAQHLAFESRLSRIHNRRMAAPKNARFSHKATNADANKTERAELMTHDQASAGLSIPAMARPSNSDMPLYDRLWTYLDRNRDGLVTETDIKELLLKLGGSEETTEHFACAADLESGNDASMDFEDFMQVVTRTRKRSRSGVLVLWLVQYALVILYSISTRMPFVLFGLEIVRARAGELWQVGVVLGSYQACRAITNMLIQIFGSTKGLGLVYFLLVSFGLAGWASAVAYADQGPWGLLALCGVGFSEVIVCLQVALMAETHADSALGVPVLSMAMPRLRSQYGSVSIGAWIAFVAAGSLYQALGFTSVCIVGVVVQALQLVLAAVYYAFRSRGRRMDGTASSEFRRLVYKLTAVDALLDAAGGRVSCDRRALAAARRCAQNNLEMETAIKQLFSDLAHGKACVGIPELERLFASAPRTPPRRAAASSALDAVSTCGDDVSSASGSTAASRCESWSSAETARLDSSDMKIVGPDSTSPPQCIERYSRGSNGPKRPSLTDPPQAPPAWHCEVVGQRADQVARRLMCLLDAKGTGECSEAQLTAFLLPRVHQALHPLDSEEQPIFGYAYVVVLTQAVTALAIGTVLSTAILTYDSLGIDVRTGGLLLGAGEALGVSALVLSSSKLVRSFFRDRRHCFPRWVLTLCARPLHCVPTLLLIGLCCICTGSGIPAVAIGGQLMLSLFNDFSVSLLNEVTAASIRNRAEYLRHQALGQWLRRLSNVITGVSGPVLFDAGRWVPWCVFGVLVVLWSLVLWGSLLHHARRLAPEAGPGLLEAFEPFINGGKVWHEEEVDYAARCGRGAEAEVELELQSQISWLRGEVGELRRELHRLAQQQPTTPPALLPTPDATAAASASAPNGGAGLFEPTPPRLTVDGAAPVACVCPRSVPAAVAAELRLGLVQPLSRQSALDGGQE